MTTPTCATAPVFDATGPLPTGTVVLQASAGTGKTYAIAALAVRFVAEGRYRLPQLLLITFSRMASAELRSRIYQRLQATRQALVRMLHDGITPGDEVDRFLTDAPADEIAVRLGRIEQALGDFDAATIATTHEFCSRMLDQLGLLADHDSSVRLAEDLSVLADQVITDVYLRDFWTSPSPPPLSDALALGRLGLEHAHLPLAQDDPVTRERAGFAERVRTQFESRKRQAGLAGFDDLVERLRAAVTDPDTGPLACQRLADRFPAVLVDEFQDTDPQQWDILSQAFAGRSTLVLIGDPKQSIYAFRGADVYAYLDAVDQADQVLTLGTDFRADPGIVDGVAHLFGQTNLGTDQAPIQMTRVSASQHTSRLTTAADAPPAYPTAVQVRRIVAPSDLPAAVARQRIDADLVAQVVELVGSRLWVHAERRWRLLRASDIAVLVSSNRRGFQLQETLARAGIAAVFCGPVSVFDTPAAQVWQHLLDAMADPSPDRVAVVALDPFIGLTPPDLASAATDATLDIATQLKDDARRFATIGVPGVFEGISRRHALVPRLLGQPGGERLLADLRHLAEVLNTQQTIQPGSPADLAHWLQRRCAQAAERPGDDRTRRLETDRQAVQIMTVHAAKGQEFPVVLLPQAADRWVPEPGGEPFIVHWQGQWMLDPGGGLRAPGSPAAERQAHRAAEEDAQALRLLYVAATRAKSRLVLWWAPMRVTTQHSALAMLERRRGTPWDPALVETVDVSGTAAPAAVGSAAPPPALGRRHFTRGIDPDWVRTSYTGLTADLHALAPAAAPPTDEPVLDAAPLAVNDAADAATPVSELPSPLAGMPAGAQFGTVVHAVFEQVDPASSTLGDDLAAACAEQGERVWLPDLDPAALARGLDTVLHTPLGALADGRCLADIPARDRLAELGFELPLGGPAPLRRTVADLADVFTAFIPGDAPLGDYGRRLGTSPAGPRVLAGFLTGSIDALLRLPGTPARFFLIDYKTNTLSGQPGEPALARHYHPAAMAQAMMDAHYPLQALLYAVATRRHLLRRVPGYDPGRDFAGIGYLFVRGMAGPQTPSIDGVPCGVFVWQPPDELVVAASDVLAGAPR